MNWNGYLYQYGKEHGGQYFATGQENSFFSAVDWNNCLLMEYRDAPMLINCKIIPGGRYADGHTAQVLLRCGLDHPYTLQIHAASIARQGIHGVLKKIGKSAQRLGADVYEDYGCPDITDTRKVKTNNPEFTRMVFRDSVLRELLLSNPKFGVSVGPIAPGNPEEPLHAVMAWCELDTLNSDDWGLEGARTYASQEEQAQFAQIFFQKLDALIALTKAVHSAVTAWRIPDQR